MNVSNDKQWVSVKEYALMKGVSERAIRKNIAAGKYQVKEVPHPKRSDQITYMVYAEPNAEPECGTNYAEPNAEPECGTNYAEPIAEPECGTNYAEPIAEPESGTAELRNCGTAEPEATTDNRQPEATTDNQSMDEMDRMDEMDEDSAALPGLGGVSGDGDLGLRSAAPQAMGCRPFGTDVSEQRSVSREQIAKRQDDAPTPCSNTKPATAVIEYVPYHKMDEAQLYALLLQEIDRRVRGAASKTAEWALITQEYNNGDLVPELKKLKGHRSERGLRHWYQKWQHSEQDMFELVHKNNAQVRGRKVTYIEQRFLEAELLCGWEKPIMTAIRTLKAQAAMGTIESPTSEATLKRWCNDFAQDNPAIWCQGRRGDKAVKDTIVKSIDRDDSSIKPLQVFVVDGHTLSVFVKHPITGKPFRPTLIMVFDWGSRYPAGMALALTEDSQHTLCAFRNAFLHSEVLPPYAYLDNGKAFRSKLFNASWEGHDLEKEFAGIFPRLGIEAHFARAYNARAKVVERFFKTMQDQWEKRQKSYCGAGIHNKPAHMARNEKWMQEMYGAKAMDYNECLDSIYEWVRYEYGMRIHQGINAKPYEVFTGAERQEDRRFDPKDLNILMLTAERKRLREEGIILNKNRYWAPELVDHVGKSVVIRYDYADLRSIFVYDERSRYICQADLRESQSAWVFAEMDNPLAAQKLYAEDREISNIQKRIRRDTAKLVRVAKRAVDVEVSKHQGIIDARKDEIAETNTAFRNPPMMPEPVKRYDVQDDIAELERVALQSDQGRESSDEKAADASTKVINLEDLLSEDEGDLAENVSFSEIQKLIGIK